MKSKKTKRDIPSYYNYSYVNDDYSVLKDKSLADENILTDFDSVKHIRLMKRFKTPDHIPCTNEIEKKFLNIDSQSNFFLRCYLPKNKISQKLKNHRISDVIIMFNGLNECERFDLYDILGAQFAEAGFASILLPTPFHLSRRIDNSNQSGTRSMKDKNKKSYEWPTDIAFNSPELYYFNFKRSIYELEELVNRINSPHSDDYGFYESYFAPNPKITLFGFSLGGLRALSCFLKSPSKYHSIISFNTGPNLQKVNIESLGLSKPSWDQTMKDLRKFIKGQNFISTPEEKKIRDLFNCLYLGLQEDDVLDDLKNNLKNYFAIQSGADAIVDTTSAKYLSEDKDLHRLVIPDVGHIPTLDLRWDNWISKAGEHIINFIKGVDEIIWAHKELEDEIKSLILNTQYYKTNIKYKNKVDIKDTDFSFERFEKLSSQVENVSRFQELYYLSKTFYPKFSELLAKFGK